MDADDRSPGPAPALVPLATLTAVLGDRHDVGDGPLGRRLVVDVRSVECTGERLGATMVGTAAADWFLVGPDGVGTIDVRMTLRTHDGALVLLEYEGRTRLGPDHPNLVAGRFETGDPRYSWLNSVQMVGRGRLDGTTVTYDLYEFR